MQAQDNSFAAQIAWAAGLFEGEGSITFHGGSSVRLTLGMTDEDVVQRFATLAGGAIRVQPRGDNRQTFYRWELARGREVGELLHLLLPFFGSRRTVRTKEALARLATNRGPNAEKTHCPHGHEYTPENTKIVRGGRVCIACGRSQRDYQGGLPNGAKTHCKRGHALSGDNLILYRSYSGNKWHRKCRECKRAESREYQRKRRAAAQKERIT